VSFFFVIRRDVYTVNIKCFSSNDVARSEPRLKGSKIRISSPSLDVQGKLSESFLQLKSNSLGLAETNAFYSFDSLTVLENAATELQNCAKFRIFTWPIERVSCVGLLKSHFYVVKSAAA
jgi:hypothetical protein